MNTDGGGHMGACLFRCAPELTNYLADPVELRILHMVAGDPKRTPTTVMFGNDNSWF